MAKNGKRDKKKCCSKVLFMSFCKNDISQAFHFTDIIRFCNCQFAIFYIQCCLPTKRMRVSNTGEKHRNDPA